jgi:hypothetical protein
MPNVIRTRTSPSDPWPFWVAGALAGVVASWLLLRAESGAPSAHARRIRDVRARWSAPRARVAPDLDAVATLLRARAGTEQLEVRSLGGGILELVGSAPDELDLPSLLTELASETGVTVVVNRAWTSRSHST